MNHLVSSCSTDLTSRGSLQVHVVSIINHFPITGATVRISHTNRPAQTIEEVSTNLSGQTPQVTLDAPELSYSLVPGSPMPYAPYALEITAPGFKPKQISGTEILPDSLAIQPVALEPEGDPEPLPDPVVIPEHTLYGNYPPKIAETEVKPVHESGEIVVSRGVVPQPIVVPDGVPADRAAKE